MKEDVESLEIIKYKSNTFFEKIKKFLRKLSEKLNLKENVIVVGYLFFTYICMELLDGYKIKFDYIFGFSTSWEERISILQDVFGNFFSYPKFLFNWLFLISMYLILYAITNRKNMSSTIVAVLGFLYLYGYNFKGNGFNNIRYICYWNSYECCKRFKVAN